MVIRLLASVAVVALWGAILGGESVALAQDHTAVAKSHSQRGTRLYQVGDYRQALEEFKAAHLAKPDPAFLYNIAQCHRQLGEDEQAITLYKRFLAASPNAPNRAALEKRIAEMAAELASRKDKAGALATPRPTDAPARAAGLGATVPSGSLLDAASPASSGAVPEITAGAVPAPKPAGSSLPYLRWVGSGLTLALVSGAIVSGLSASSKFSDLQKSCGATSAGCSAGEIDSLKSRALMTNILWGAAGVAAVGTGIAFYLAPHGGAVQVAWNF
jgi:Tfp pilus assembly protein PilF